MSKRIPNMNGRQYYARQSAIGNGKRVKKYGHKRVVAVDTGTALLCLFPPAAIVFALGKLTWDMCHQKEFNTYA